MHPLRLTRVFDVRMKKFYIHEVTRKTEKHLMTEKRWKTPENTKNMRNGFVGGKGVARGEGVGLVARVMGW